jgi:DNA repair exonuclease SbcCD ATPase subunit
MSTKNAVGLESSLTTEEQSTEETITALVDVVESQQQQIEELTEQVHDLEDDLDEQEDGLQEEQETRAKDDAQLRQRITAVEEDIEDLEDDQEDANPTQEAGQTATQETMTPLEDLVTLPDTVLDEERANTQRAVFVARDVSEYTKSVPAGRVITTSELRTVLRAGTDSRGHRQTVSRVIDLLDDLGGDDTKIVEKRGTKRLVFTDEIVERLERLTTDTGLSQCRDAVEG